MSGYFRWCSYLLKDNLLLQQCHLNPQRLHLSDLCLCCISYGRGQGCNPSISPRATCPGGAKTASFWPPLIPRFPLWWKMWLFLECERELPAKPTTLNSWPSLCYVRVDGFTETPASQRGVSVGAEKSFDLALQPHWGSVWFSIRQGCIRLLAHWYSPFQDVPPTW